MLQRFSTVDPGCFGGSYAIARQRFRTACRQLPPGLRQDLREYMHPLAGPDGEVLACDVAQLGQRPDPHHVLVLISATHGVEGFAGSAIQLDCMPLLTAAMQQDASLGVLMVHALNPWGFAWVRRYDHEGIDLNRNFVDFNQPLPVNEAYDALHADLVDPQRLADDSVDDLWSAEGVGAFAEIVTRGQYAHADGCFFGGTGPSWSRRLLEQAGDGELFAGAKRIAVLDLHTGLGAYGHGELINDHTPGSAGDVCAQRWYGDEARSVELGESVSTMKHGLLDFFWHRLIGERGCFVTLEFGTYAMDRLLTCLLQEQLYHATVVHDHGRRDITNRYVQALREFFCPPDPQWQRQVLQRGRQVMDMTLRGLGNE